jgi:hypothetical protein
LSTVSPRSQPIRSAITVAGILGYAFSNSRILGSTPSTADPAGRRTYLGGASDATAVRTVFLETPSTRAISLIGMPNDLCNLRISAQSSTDNNPFLLGSTEPRSPQEGSIFGRRHGVIFQASPTAVVSAVSSSGP